MTKKEQEARALRGLFGERLKLARERAWLSQKGLACEAGLPEVISRYECGDRLPSLRNLCRLADTLKVSADYLLGRKKGIK